MMSAMICHPNSVIPLLCFCSPFSKHLNLHNPNFFTPHTKVLFSPELSQKLGVLKSSYISSDGNCTFVCSCKQKSDVEQESVEVDLERPPFDINLAVVLAGFAFEAYSSPPESIGKREVDAADCQTVFLSESFLREVYDGQLFIKLKKGVNFPAMDPWGTSDPYVVMQLDGQVIKSTVKWGTKEPTWNEDLTLNIKIPPTKILQVAAWDANLVTPHKRMGNAGISLESLCDGAMHEVLVELEGLGGGGGIHLEVRYRSFDEIDEDKKWWKIPYISDLLAKNSFESALKMVLGSDTVKAQQFVQYALGQLRSFDHAYPKDRFSKGDSSDMGVSGKSINPVGGSDMPLKQESSSDDGSRKSINLIGGSDMSLQQKNNMGGFLDDLKGEEDSSFQEYRTENDSVGDISSSLLETRVNGSMQSDKFFWKNFADVLNQTVVQKLGFPIPEKIRWDGFDMLNRIGIQSKKIAEAGYVESGLASPEIQGVDDGDETSTIKSIQSLPDIKKLSWDVLRQTDSILGALMLLTTTFSQLNKEARSVGNSETEKDASTAVVNGGLGYSTSDKVVTTMDGSSLDQRKVEEMKALFSTAESAMEAWAMLATSLGHPSFIKSEFEKICFLDNTSTDTQVAIWRDFPRKRLVVAFRGTEQARWKDLRTDLMLVPTGLNPERLGGDIKQEVQVHSGFLSAYDSVRNRLMSLIKLSIGFVDDGSEAIPKWHIYVTGHSLGGALATLLALELSSSQMAKCGAISVTMYNFGSPRVGNKRFVDVYNEKVEDSWRVVNHRDIIPTVPRLMGYCHVAQPVYLAAGDLKEALVSMELLADGYQGDVIGESTPDVLVGEFMKGEKELIERILLTEINIFRSIRDGSALMQHMEDFYYITLLENVRSNYRTVGISNSNEEGSV